MPLQPQSQPSGPQLRLLKTLCLAFDVPAVEHHHRRTVGLVVGVRVGNEQQIGRGRDPDAAEAELDAGVVEAVVEEDRLLVELPVAVLVFEDRDAIGSGLAGLDPGG